MPKLTISIILTAFSFGVGLYGLHSFGLDAEIPTKWGLDGQVTDRNSPLIAFGIMPVVQSALLLFLSKLHVLEPRAENLEKSRRAVNAVMTAVFALLTAIQTLIYTAAAELFQPDETVVFVTMGLMLCVVGNYCGKLHSTFFIGIRTPWTLSSETVWRQTHRLAGKLLFVAGAALILLPFFTSTQRLQYLLIIVISASVLVPVGYSWLVWRREQHKN